MLDTFIASDPIFMRKPLAIVLMLIFICALPLQAYAQGCAMHCAFAQADMHEMHEMPQHDLPAMQQVQQMPDGDDSCAQSTLCQMVQCVQFSVLPAATAGLLLAGTFAPPIDLVKPLLGIVLPSLDRPPILS